MKRKKKISARPETAIEKFTGDLLAKFAVTAEDVRKRMPEVKDMTDMEKLSLYWMSGCRMDTVLINGKAIQITTMYPCGIDKVDGRYVVTEGKEEAVKEKIDK